MKVEKLSLYVTLFATALVALLNGIYGGGHFDGADIIVILMLLLPSIKNLYSNKAKTINNKSYYYLLTLVSTYISVVSIYALYIYIIKLPLEANNESTLLFFNHLIYMYLSMLVLFIIQAVSKKTVAKHVVNNKFIYVAIALMGYLETIEFAGGTMFGFPIVIGISIFYLIILALDMKKHDSKELKLVYISTSLLLAIEYVFVPIVLIYGLYRNLNTKRKQ